MKKIALVVLLAVAGVVAWVWQVNLLDEPDVSVAVAEAPATPALLERGAYLARAGNCAGCHTSRGGAAYAGGIGIDTPFGVVYTSNLTPDGNTGIGSWSSAHFWRALHNGRSKDGRLLYPAFPYPHYTSVSRADADALYAFLRSQPPVQQAATPHALRWPYRLQPALAVWRSLYFRPGSFVPDTTQSAEWNRGAYLVRGLGHCGACHTARNALGGSDSSAELGGGLIPQQGWYAPALTSPLEAGVAGWPRDEVVRLLHSGVAAQASVQGPMADVVRLSTQYLSPADVNAMAAYLQALPQTAAPQASVAAPVPARVAQRGAALYDQHCVQCHGAQGQGMQVQGAVAYPALAGNRAVAMASTANLVQVVLHGGFAPATAGNPRPFGMPPYVLVLNDSDIAAVLTHIRSSWGNHADGVTELEVNRQRAGEGG